MLIIKDAEKLQFQHVIRRYPTKTQRKGTKDKGGHIYARTLINFYVSAFILCAFSVWDIGHAEIAAP
ncbi:MAG: hypothetical protein DRI57_12385 [Deltaproteobacteria bacterium]|nr:MAG: hypothetical protein DRI57_12385 [Deltaproteobacteria bacterium]